MTDNSRRLLDNLDRYVNDVIFDLVDENETLEGQVDELREQVAKLAERGYENPSECFEGMTNGDVLNVILRRIFPRTIFIRGIDPCHKTKSIVYSEEWENAPYKAKKGDE
jgi:hypothetical protein